MSKPLNDDVFKCTDCGEICALVEETFDYAGTHCTYGRSGTHRTGNYLSDCCCADIEWIGVRDCG